MADVVQILGSAAIGAIITLIIREIFAWKFSELERRRKSLTKLFEKIYGPIRVVMWRMEVEEQETHKYVVYHDEYLEIRRIVYLFEHEFDQTYRELLDMFLEEGKECAFKRHAFMDSNREGIFDLIKATEKK